MNRKAMQSIFFSVVVGLLFVFVSAAAAQPMKIAVPATGSEENAFISKETGRAPFFLFFDEKGIFLEAKANPFLGNAGGVSRLVVSLLADNKVNLIIAEAIGDKMKRALLAHQIEFVHGSGPARDAVQAAVQKTINVE